MQNYALDLSRDISSQLDVIGQHTREDGVDCLAYSTEETTSMMLVAKEAYNLGAQILQDQAGNITAVVKGADQDLKVAFGGSHLDAVPQGGQYDGRAGVLLQLGVLKMLHDGGLQKLSHDVVFQIFRAEESPRFGKALLGSAFATGLADPDDFNRVSKIKGDNQNLKQAMAEQKLPVDELLQKVMKNEPLLPLSMIGNVIEMHIEQANVVRGEKKDLGIVTAIRGNMRADIGFIGAAGHTGGEAQYVQVGNDMQDVRQEASRGLVELAYLLEQKCTQIAREGRDIVFSVPVINTPDSSDTKICDDCSARLEVRSTDMTVLTEVKQFIEENMQRISRERNLGLSGKNNVLVSNPVSELSEDVIQTLEQSASRHNIETCRLPSGAGHDAMNMALAGVPTSMVFTPHNGLSHRPDEDMVLSPGDDPYGIDSPFSKALSTIYSAQVFAKMPQKSEADKGISFVEAMVGRGAKVLNF